MPDELDAVKSQHEAENGSECVVRYGVGVVAFEERMGEYVMRYEAETIPQLLELMESLKEKWARDKAAKKAANGG